MVQGTTVTLILTERWRIWAQACLQGEDWNTVFPGTSFDAPVLFFPLTSVFSFLLPQRKGVKQRVGLHLCCSYLINQEKRSGKVIHIAPKCTGFQDLCGEDKKSDMIRLRMLLALEIMMGNTGWNVQWRDSVEMAAPPELNRWSLLSPELVQLTRQEAAEKIGKTWLFVLKKQLISTPLSAPPIKINKVTPHPPFPFFCVWTLWSSRTVWCWGSRQWILKRF